MQDRTPNGAFFSGLSGKGSVLQRLFDRSIGHKSIKNTLIYIQLEEAIYAKRDDDFICEAARTVEEAKILIEAGFNSVCEFDEVKLFRKRK